MATGAAAFSSWEEAVCKYIAFGGTSGFTGGLPGMVTSPSPGAGIVYIRPLKTYDPVAAPLPTYPTPFSTDGLTVRGVGEPTLAEWSTLGLGPFGLRLSGPTGAFEVVDLGGGNWGVRNKAGVSFFFNARASGDTGGTLSIPYAALCLSKINASTGKRELYAIAIGEFDTPLDAVAGGVGLTIQPQEMTFRVL